MRKLIIGTIAATVLAAASLPAAARAHVDLYVGVAPPVAPYEVVPPPRVGFVWVPGVWQWRHGHYHWAPGHWVRRRAGYAYEPAGWVAYGGRWGYHSGAWVRVP